jgi:hypothetical protein
MKAFSVRIWIFKLGIEIRRSALRPMVKLWIAMDGKRLRDWKRRIREVI